MDDITEEQIKTQKIFEDVILPEGASQKGESHISVSFTPEEYKRVCNFFGSFAYD